MNLIPIGPNQTEIDTGKARVFYSYRTPVAAIVKGTAYRTSTNHSKTTSRHISAWLIGNGFGGFQEKPQTWFDTLKG